MRNSVYFLSDLHLGAKYFTNPLAAEKHVVAFLDSIAEDAEAIYLLGDVLDYWYEYRYAVPRGFVRFFGKLAQLADSGVEITWLTGNHDIWIFDYLPAELGIRVVDGHIVERIGGLNLYLAHGDRLGKRNRKFRIIQNVFRNKFCQRAFSLIHPDLTIPLAHKWSGNSRKTGTDYIHGGEILENAFQRLCNFANAYNANLPAEKKIDCFLFGHLHIVKRQSLPAGGEVIELGDWLNHFSYGRLASGNLTLHSFPVERG